MFEEYKYKTELHAHTSPASMCSDILPEEMVRVYCEAGYKSITITNHFMYDEQNSEEKITAYLKDFYKTAKLGKKAGLNVILGAEIRFSENVNDYLVYGICEEDLYEINSYLSLGIDTFYKKFKNDKNVILQAHPFRNNMSLASPQSLDGIEVFNMHPGHNSRIAFAARYAREHNMLISAGSDFHHPNQHALCSIMTKEPLANSYELAEVLKNRAFVIDVSGYKIIPE